MNRMTLKNKKMAAGTLALIIGVAAFTQTNFADALLDQAVESMPATVMTEAAVSTSDAATESIEALPLTESVGTTEAAETIPAIMTTPATESGK